MEALCGVEYHECILLLWEKTDIVELGVSTRFDIDFWITASPWASGEIFNDHQKLVCWQKPKPLASKLTSSFPLIPVWQLSPLLWSTFVPETFSVTSGYSYSALSKILTHFLLFDERMIPLFGVNSRVSTILITYIQKKSKTTKIIFLYLYVNVLYLHMF